MVSRAHTHTHTHTHTGIGRSVEVASRVQKLKATVWLAEDFPLSLQEQIMPIIDLMVRVPCVVLLHTLTPKLSL